MMEIFLPIYRADYTLLDAYSHVSQPKLKVAVTLLGGISDAEISEKQLRQWQMECDRKVALEMFEGGHFYVHAPENMNRLVDTIHRTLGL